MTIAQKALALELANTPNQNNHPTAKDANIPAKKIYSAPKISCFSAEDLTEGASSAFHNDGGLTGTS